MRTIRRSPPSLRQGLCQGLGLGLLLCLGLTPLSQAAQLKEVLAWKHVKFAFSDAADEVRAISDGEYVPENNIPLGLDVSGDRLFVTVPRWRRGVAATVNVVTVNNATYAAASPPAPSLAPYPNWEAHRLPAEGEPFEGKLVSVFRVRADPCKRLWMLDTGLDDLLGNATRVAPARLVIYDLRSDTLLRDFALPPRVTKEDSFWAHIAVDVTEDTCDAAFAYLSDVGASALVVYSWQENDAWRVEHHFFHFDPLRGNFHVGKVNFQWTDGVFGAALSAPDAAGARTVYFHPLASCEQFAVSNRVLQNRSAAGDYYAFRHLGSRGERAQATASFLHEPSGVLFLTQVNRDAVACWNTNKPFSSAHVGIVRRDAEALVFPNDLKVCGGGNLWVLSNRLGDFLYGRLSADDVNFRVFRMPVAQAVAGTVCE